MVSIKEKRIEQGLTQPDLAKCINKDVPLVSKFENYVCLPTPEDATKIAKVLKCTTVLELYDEEDISFDKYNKKAKKIDCEFDTYKLTVKLPREAIVWLTRENLNLFKYSSITNWVNDCYEKFVKKVKGKLSHIKNKSRE